MQVGFGFWGAKTLLSAVELGLFSELAREPLDAETLRVRLGLHPRGARDFFDALVALSLLERTNGRYHNTPETDLFLDAGKSSYLGGLFEMLNVRLYGFWGLLTEALRTGQPQNEAKTGGNFFQDALYQPGPWPAAWVPARHDGGEPAGGSADRPPVRVGPVSDIPGCWDGSGEPPG